MQKKVRNVTICQSDGELFFVQVLIDKARFMVARERKLYRSLVYERSSRAYLQYILLGKTERSVKHNGSTLLQNSLENSD